MAQPALKLADDTKRKPTDRFTFTKQKLAEVKPPAKGRKYVYDSKQPGLAYAVTDKGHGSFYFYKKINGSPVKLKITATTIDQARRKAHGMMNEYIEGRDPAELRRRQRGEMTLGQLRKLYVDEHAIDNCTERTRAVEESLYKLTLEKWAGKRLSAIKSSDVAKLHAEIGRTRSRTSANRAVQLLRRLYRYARKLHDYKGENPAEGVDLFYERTRERYLTSDELPRFLDALKHEDEIFRHFFEMALLTGARRSNLQAMRWKHINLQARTWTVPGDESKNKADMVIPLVKRAAAILRLRRRKQAKAAADPEKPVEQSPYVFPAVRRKHSAHMGQPTAAWRRICTRAEIEGLRIHDLRRSLGSWQAMGGASLPIIGASLGHRDARSAQIYGRIANDPVRASMEAATRVMIPGRQAKKQTKKNG
ncbi:MAG: site-specific integrase [Phycisphaeraceae bacterium]